MITATEVATPATVDGELSTVPVYLPLITVLSGTTVECLVQSQGTPVEVATLWREILTESASPQDNGQGRIQLAKVSLRCSCHLYSIAQLWVLQHAYDIATK